MYHTGKRKKESHHIQTFEEKKKEVAQFQLTSDIFFSKVMEDKKACEQLIQIILGLELKVKEVRVQYRIGNLHGHSVILDVLAETLEGKLVNVEMQVENDDFHIKRVRYYQGIIDTKMFEKGKKYKEVPDLYLIFITRSDFIKLGEAIYFIERRIKGRTEEESRGIQNGVHEIYVNLQGKTSNQRLEELLRFMKASKEENVRKTFQAISDRVHYLKENPEGVEIMCEILEKKKQEGRQEGELLKSISLICKKMKKGYSAQEIGEILEEDTEWVREIMEIAREYEPFYDAEKIMDEWNNR